MSDKQLLEATGLSDKEAERQQIGESECRQKGHWCYLFQCVFFTNQAISETDNRNLWASQCFHLFTCVGKPLFLAFFELKKTLFLMSPCCKSFKVNLQRMLENTVCGMSKSLLGKICRLNLAREPFSSVTLYCTAGFGCMVIGNVLPGDSYHSCLSETGTLMACGDGCLKFSGEVCCWLRICRSEITSATGYIPVRQETGWQRLWEVLPGYCRYLIYREKQD